MSAYRAMIGARFRTLLQYRAAAFAGIVTQLFWGLIRVMIFAAFYRSTTAEQPMSLAQVTSYIWLSQATFRMLPWGVDAEIRQMMRDGTIAYEMLRPVDLYSFWYCRAIALHSAPALLRAVPMLPIAYLFLGLRAPASIEAAFAYILSICLALLLSASISSVMTISMMWTITGEGIARIVMITMGLLSGMYLPLPLFPEWAQPILYALPFGGLVDAPSRLYMGHIPASELLSIAARQVVWIVAFIAIGRLLLNRGTRRLVIQGG